jgi:hypothetical protein
MRPRRGPRTDVRLPGATPGPSLSTVDIASPRRRRAAGLLAALVLAALAYAGPADARDDDGERVEVRVTGTCGRESTARLRLRAEDGEIRVDLRVRTPSAGVWRVAVLHERRLVRRARVRAHRGARGFEYRVVLPDFAGPDAVAVRAVAPRGETCSAGATVAGS